MTNNLKTTRLYLPTKQNNKQLQDSRV